MKDRLSQGKKLSAELLPRNVDWHLVTRLFVFFGISGFVLAVLVLVYESLMIPVGISAFLTYLLLPLVERLQRRGIPRLIAVSSLVIISLLAIGLGLMKLVPELYTQTLSLIRLVPVAISLIFEKWLPIAEQFVIGLKIIEAPDVHQWFSASSLLGRVNSQLESGVRGLWQTGASLLGGVVNLTLIPLLTFSMLNDYHATAFRIHRLVPRDLVQPVGVLVDRVNVTLRTVIKGQVTVAGILAVLYVIGLSAVGMQQAVVIGVVAGVCRIIPYLDLIVGVGLSIVVFLSNFSGWGQIFSVGLVFFIVQLIDGIFITPRVVGERVGLHPIVVIISVLAFADWFGFWGVLFAIPTLAIIKAILVTVRPYYLGSVIYDPILEKESKSNIDSSVS